MKSKTQQIDEDNKKRIEEFQGRFLGQTSFPPFKGVGDAKRDYVVSYKHTASLIFIRTKFLFLGILDAIEKKNAFAAFAILKAYWEAVAAMGYFLIRIENLIKEEKYEEIVHLSRKIAMGGKKYPTEEMVNQKGDVPEDFLQPNLLTMMQKIDKDIAKMPGTSGDPLGEVFSENYNLFIAEAGHTTFLGLFPGARKLADESLLPDINRSGDEEDEKAIINYVSLASVIFFYYWDRI